MKSILLEVMETQFPIFEIISFNNTSAGIINTVIEGLDVRDIFGITR